ncbi:MAG: hypothetical protein HYT62_03080 [Candidatus Yanofskybacteria bacterium]|nr:hypothetical protein [Candidatus Yanofskybacteria bacterium]
MKAWIFNSMVFAPRDLKKVLGAVRASYEIVGSPRDYRVRVVPDEGHEKGVLTICRKIFGKKEEIVRN